MLTFAAFLFLSSAEPTPLMQCATYEMEFALHAGMIGDRTEDVQDTAHLALMMCEHIEATESERESVFRRLVAEYGG